MDIGRNPTDNPLYYLNAYGLHGLWTPRELAAANGVTETSTSSVLGMLAGTGAVENVMIETPSGRRARYRWVGEGA